MKTKIPKKTLQALKERADGRCEYCGGIPGVDSHHIKSRARGGTHDIENLILLCRACHRRVHNGKVRSLLKHSWEK